MIRSMCRISSYLNENGKFDYDEEILEKAALDVYEYALKLEKRDQFKGLHIVKKGIRYLFF